MHPAAKCSRGEITFRCRWAIDTTNTHTHLSNAAQNIHFFLKVLNDLHYTASTPSCKGKSLLSHSAFTVDSPADFSLV